MQFRIGRTSCARDVQPHPRAVPGDPLERYPWMVEVASLEDLVSLYDGEVVVSRIDGHLTVELVDDYRES